MLERLYDALIFTVLSTIAIDLFYKYYHKITFSKKRLLSLAGIIAVLYIIFDSIFDKVI